MTIISESIIIKSLADAIDEWHTKNDKMIAEHGFSCWVGENYTERMATAALSVLFAIGEAQDFMDDEGLLKEDELPK